MFKNLSIHSNSGYVTKGNLSGVELKVSLDTLGPIQAEFHAKYLSLIPKSYSNKWPLDKLHWWSRPAEYAFVIFHLSNLISKSSKKLSILEVGPGCSFMPYALSRLGVRSIEFEEIDDSVIKFWQDISRDIGIEITGRNLETIPESKYDIIYSVSVVEHVTYPELIVKKLINQLANDGTLILTLDIDLSNQGNYGLTVDQLNQILNIKNIDFTLALDTRTITHNYDVATPVEGWWVKSSNASLMSQVKVSIPRQMYRKLKYLIGYNNKKSNPQNISVLKLIGKKIDPI